jgi:HlyD family secretion protein
MSKSTSSKPKSRRTRTWILLAVALAAVAGFLGYRYWKAKQSAVPEGIAWGNGRMEAKLVDASAKEPLRVKEVLVAEGDLVKPGQVLVRLDVATLESQLAEAKASVAAAQEQQAVANAAIARRRGEIALAKTEVVRSRALVQEHAGSQRELDVRNTALATTQAGLAEEEAKLQAAKQEVDVAQAQEATIQTRIADATLTSPVVGRVLYRLAEPGEVLAAGGKALTLVDLSDVYMEIFLPSEQAARVKLGTDARLTVDHEPGLAAPARVTFVSPEAQFTPKEVETRSEREKLMFRVKLQVPSDLVLHYVDRIKTGVRGVGYVKLNDSTAWPDRLQHLVGANAPGTERTTAPADSPSAKTPNLNGARP